MSAVAEAQAVARYTVEHETSYAYRIAVSLKFFAHAVPRSMLQIAP